MATNQKYLRKCLGKFATGVTVVTCTNDAAECFGITANSFSSVSLDPPLLLWNIAKTSASLKEYLNAEYFAVNVLAENQKNISTHFSASGPTLFDSVEFSSSSTGVPILTDTLACFECCTHQIHESGDHYIIIGEVQKLHQTNKPPLLFFDGDYSKVATPKQ